MKSTPLVSIMIPAYNAEDSILRAIKSLSLQTYENWECIVVDDGSEDKTSQLVESIKDNRIKLITLKNNMGIGYARQVALEACKGEFIAMLDSDDWYYPNKLQSQINAFKKNSDVDLVSCLMAVTDRSGKMIGVRGSPSVFPIKFVKPTTVPMPHASTMVRRLAIDTQSYDSSLKYGEDVDFLRRVLLNRKYLVINSIGYVYEEGYSNRFLKSFKSYFYSAKAYSKFLDKYPLFICKKMTSEYLKALRLSAYYSIGQYDKCIKNRSQNATHEQIAEFSDHLTAIVSSK